MNDIQTQKEFLEILKENKYFENFEEQSLYNFRALKFYLDKVANLSINGKKFTSKDILTPSDNTNYRYTNLAFKSLRKKYGFE